MQIPEALLVILIVHKLSKMESKLADEVKKSGGNFIYFSLLKKSAQPLHSFLYSKH
tara:strand:- start:170 stop:337 length:168 start_codon:yes stop_codon:yes gene_type:complete